MTAQQLKNSILQMAVQGKLVPQDPSDEPASVLLKKIKAEKDALIKSGKLKRDRHESVIIRDEDGHFIEKKDGKTTDITDEIPFDIPETWEWVRLNTLLHQASTGPFGSMLHQSDYVEKGIPLVNPANIINATISDYKIKKVSSLTAERLSTYKLSSKDVVIGRRGEMGRSAVVTNREHGWLCGTGCFFVTPSSEFLSDYLVFLLSTPYIKETLLSKSVGTTMNNLNHGILGHLLVPLPSKKEQKRILDKIGELLPHIEEYDRAETEVRKLNETFPDMLKKSILQWAIQGRLVPQDPTDEPASELLKRIKAEKAALIKSGKLKKEKPLPPISEDKIPFDIPDSWEWCRIGQVFNLQAGKNISSGSIKEEFVAGYYPCYGGNGLRGYVTNYNHKGDYVLIGRQGALCGNINYATGFFYATEHAVAVDVFAGCDTKWCGLFLTALNLNQYSTATAQPGLAVSKINNILIPLPPFAEQKRIVEKIENLMSTLFSL